MSVRYWYRYIYRRFPAAVRYFFAAITLFGGIGWLAACRPFYALVLLGLGVGFAAFLFVLHRPAILFTLLVVEIVIGGNGHIVEVPIGGISLRQLIFAAAMGTWLVRNLLHPQWLGGRKDLAMMVLGFFAYILLFVFLGALRGNVDVYTDAVTWLYLLLFFPFVEVFNTPKRMNYLVTWFLAAVVCLSVTQLALLGWFIADWFGTSSSIYHVVSLIGGGVTPTFGIYRIFLSGSIFYQIGATMLLRLWSTCQSRVPRWILLVVLALVLTALALGMTRGMWLGFAVSALVLFVLLTTRQKIRTVVYATLGLLILGVLLASWKPDLALALGDKIVGIGVSRAYDESIAWKFYELSAMMDAIAHHPFLGTGMGAVPIEGLGTNLYFHNTYLQFWLKTGIIGLLFLIIVLGVIILTGYRFLKHCKDLVSLAVVRGLWAGFIGTFVTTAFNPFIGSPMGLTMIALFLAMLVVYDGDEVGSLGFRMANVCSTLHLSV